MGNKTILAVDTGNRLIKTPHTEFNAGIVRHGKQQPAIKGDVLKFNGEYFSLTNTRVPYKRDKTEDDTYFILTLFAAAKEFEILNTGFSKEVILSVGLPPQHLSQYMDKYISYFSNNGMPMNFEYNGKAMTMTVDRVLVFPQGFSAVAPIQEKLLSVPRAYIIDIGGWTTDVIMMVDGVADMSFCETFAYGMIQLYGVIESKMRAKLGVESCDDVIIESLLAGESDGTQFGKDAVELAKTTADEYAKDLIRKLEEKGVELKMSLPIFIGGGAQRLKDSLLTVDMREPWFLPSVRANAHGYEYLTRQMFGAQNI